MKAGQKTFTVCDTVAAVGRKAILLQSGARPSWGVHDQQWIPKSQIVESDTEIDEIAVGEEVTIEIPLWLAREKGLAE